MAITVEITVITVEITVGQVGDVQQLVVEAWVRTAFFHSNTEVVNTVGVP